MQEALNQAVAGMASDLKAGGRIELRPEPGVRSSGPAVSAVRGSVNVLIEGSERLVVPAAFSLALASLVAEAQERSASPSNPTSATLDLLLDLELPVSVSFGTAQVTLQDALRYSAGSLIELERTVDDPVEIIVNDFVIARGEVVVVNGYYGVRIQQIASRRERLQTTGNLLAANGGAGPSKTPAHL
jgi:flagellar motor switch protein FliN/FliY